MGRRPDLGDPDPSRLKDAALSRRRFYPSRRWKVVARRWISERRTVKVLIEPRGAIVAFTMKRYSYLLFLTRRFVGLKKIRTADRIVARAGYSAPAALELIQQTYPYGP